MIIDSSTVKHTFDECHDKVFTIKDGILGFESCRQFTLTMTLEEAPFMRLTSVDPQGPSFIIIDPWQFFGDYSPNPGSTDVEKIETTNPLKIRVAALVTIRGDQIEDITVNLAAPLLLNVDSLLGKQAILLNHMNYSIKQHIIPTKTAGGHGRARSDA